MTVLLLAALIWIGVHVGIAGTRVRDLVVARIGDGPFRGLFSVVSIVALVFLVRAWLDSPTESLWFTPNWLDWILVVAMLPAFLLLVASVSQPNPTMIGPPGIAARPPRGMTRVTRHPMLWSFAIWAAVHVIGTGDSASLVFFGTFLVTVLAGMRSLDAKLARRDRLNWEVLAKTTSALPFAAIIEGRNHLVPREFGMFAPLLGVVGWVLMLLLHPLLFGVSPLT